MITFLRLAGLGTAAVWLGGTVFFALVVEPMFGRAELLRLLGPLHAGETGIITTERFHLFQVVCAGAALVHSLTEWLYSGRPLDRRLIFLLLALLLAGSFGRLYVTPKCRGLNMQAYLGPNRQILRQATTPAQQGAERALATWQGVAMIFQIITFAGVVLYFMHQSSPNGVGVRGSPRTRMRI